MAPRPKGGAALPLLSPRARARRAGKAPSGENDAQMDELKGGEKEARRTPKGRLKGVEKEARKKPEWLSCPKGGEKGAKMKHLKNVSLNA